MATNKKITLVEAFEKVTAIITQLKSGDLLSETAAHQLNELATQVNAEIPGVAFKAPMQDELKALRKEPEYESSYSDSNCW